MHVADGEAERSGALVPIIYLQITAKLHVGMMMPCIQARRNYEGLYGISLRLEMKFDIFQARLYQFSHRKVSTNLELRLFSAW